MNQASSPSQTFFKGGNGSVIGGGAGSNVMDNLEPKKQNGSFATGGKKAQ